jgi:hypothetical protein
MFRFASLTLASLIAAALVTGAEAYPLKNPNKPALPNPQKPLNFNPNLPKKPPIIVTPNPNVPKKPPIIVTPNPKFYPKPYYPKYPVVVHTVQPVYVASKPVVVRAAAPAKSSCLTKETTAEGLVIFRDTCTNEVATTAVPGTPAATAMDAQQAVLAKAMAETTGAAAAAAEPTKDDEPKK